MKELNERELENVSGGSGSDAWDRTAAYLPQGHGRRIEQNDVRNYANQEFYVVDDARPWLYCWGTLFSSTGIYHYVWVKGKSENRNGLSFPVTDAEIGDTSEFTGAEHVLYLFH